MAVFDVLKTDGTPPPHAVLGQAEIDADGRLKLIHAESGAQADLDRAFADLNGRDGLVVKLPPERGDAKFAIRKRKIARDDPEFFNAIQDNLRRWHHMTLTPAT